MSDEENGSALDHFFNMLGHLGRVQAQSRAKAEQEVPKPKRRIKAKASSSAAPQVTVSNFASTDPSCCVKKRDP